MKLKLGKKNEKDYKEILPFSENIFIYVKSDLTDDFSFGNVWLYMDGKTLCKIHGETKFIYDTENDTEFYIDILPSSVALIMKNGENEKVICHATNSLSRNLGEFAQKANHYIKEGYPDIERFREKFPEEGRSSHEENKDKTPDIDRRGVLKRLLKYAMQYKKYIAAIFIFIIISSLLSIAAPYIHGTVFFDQVLKKGHPHYGKIFELTAVLTALQLVSTLFTIIYGRANSRFANEVVYNMRTDVFSSMQRLSIKYFTDKETGALMTRVNSDAEEIQWFMLDGIPFFIINILKIISIAVIMISMQPSIAALIMIPGPFILLFFRKYMPKFNKMYSRNFRRRSDMTSRMNDSFTAVRVVKAFGKEKTENNSFSRVSRLFADSQADIQRKSGTIFPLVSLSMWMGSLFIYIIGGILIINGKMGFGTLTSFVGYVGMIYSPLEWLANTVHQFASALNSANRIFEIIDAESEIKESENPKVIKDFKGEVRFEHVNFSYIPNRMVLKDISFTAAAGEHIGIVGSSGAGKSTLINLIARLYDTDSGTIYFDGTDIKELSLKWLHEQIGTVLQDTYLFMGTVYDNIAYTKPDASPDEVINAAKMADAHDFIMKMDDGYDTWIGTGGKGLSGGERQRISLARAILKKPKILILDEATSAVDTQTELHIQKALEILSKGRTTFNIAHRLSTLRNADRLIVIDNGNLVEMGTHAEIFALEGVYFKLYQIQKDALKMRGLQEAKKDGK